MDGGKKLSVSSQVQPMQLPCSGGLRGHGAEGRALHQCLAPMSCAQHFVPNALHQCLESSRLYQCLAWELRFGEIIAVLLLGLETAQAQLQSLTAMLQNHRNSKAGKDH